MPLWSPSQSRLLLLALTILSTVAGFATDPYPAQSQRKPRGCFLRAFHGDWVPDQMRSCGIDQYALVFTGTVASVTDISDYVQKLELIPDEFFVGSPGGNVTATVIPNCLIEQNEIRKGDKWLFYLGRGDAKGVFDIPIYSPSKPLAQAEDDLETLRHLARLGDAVILKGNVKRLGQTTDEPSVPVVNRKVVATDEYGNEHVAPTNRNGNYEFELPANVYKVTASAEPGLREMENTFPRENISLGKGACLEVDFSMLVDGRLEGQVTTAEGKPASLVNVTIIPTHPVHPAFTITADEQGHFEAGGRPPGTYIVGVGIMASFSSDEWRRRVYFPGVPTREQATEIELGEGEQRIGLDFKLPDPEAKQ